MEIAELLIFASDILLAFGLIVLVFVGFMWYMSRQEAYQLHQELDQIAQELMDGQLIPLTVEVDGNQFLCYNSQTMTFVCQGCSLEEIYERFQQRFPNKSIAIYNGDESALGVLKQQLKEFRENSNSIGSAS